MAPPPLTIAARAMFGPLLKSEPLGDAIVNDGLAIAINPDPLFAVDSPQRRRVGADGQSHITHLTRELIIVTARIEHRMSSCPAETEDSILRNFRYETYRIIPISASH